MKEGRESKENRKAKKPQRRSAEQELLNSKESHDKMK